MFGIFDSKVQKTKMPEPDQALAGREDIMPRNEQHFVNGNSISSLPEGMEQILFGLGCFWGAERLFWKLDGVHSTSVGYAAGYTPNPTYQEVCSGQTGHNEVVRVVFDPKKISLQALLEVFWQSHDPTQGMRQGNDVGTQYRSGIYIANEAHGKLALSTRSHYQEQLKAAGFGEITTEIKSVDEFYFAEDYHQQYLAKEPNGYCGIGGLGVSY